MRQLSTADSDVQPISKGVRLRPRLFTSSRATYPLRYTEVRQCPACGEQGSIVDHLDRGMYRFGPFDIPYPDGRYVPIASCNHCGLIYKAAVPDAFDLRLLLAKAASKVWKSHGYDYRGEREFVMRFVGPRPTVDVIEIGSADGDMVGAFKDIPGRRSALDVVWNDRCSSRLTSEYVLQYLEDPLCWSGEPYDVVLAFDVMEHLYAAHTALYNLALLTRPGGVVVMQTGNGDYVRNTSSLRDWWYINLLEHHMVWTRDALSIAAERQGFRVEYFEPGRHKDSRHMPAWKRAGANALRAVVHWPRAIRAATALTSYDPRLVSDPRADDHFTAVLRRV